MELKFLALPSGCLLLGVSLSELVIQCTTQVQNQKIVNYAVTSQKQKCLQQQNPTNHLSRQASQDVHIHWTLVSSRWPLAHPLRGKIKVIFWSNIKLENVMYYNHIKQLHLKCPQSAKALSLFSKEKIFFFLNFNCTFHFLTCTAYISIFHLNDTSEEGSKLFKDEKSVPTNKTAIS